MSQVCIYIRTCAFTIIARIATFASISYIFYGCTIYVYMQIGARRRTRVSTTDPYPKTAAPFDTHRFVELNETMFLRTIAPPFSSSASFSFAFTKGEDTQIRKYRFCTGSFRTRYPFSKKQMKDVLEAGNSLIITLLISSSLFLTFHHTVLRVISKIVTSNENFIQNILFYYAFFFLRLFSTNTSR